MLTFWTYFRTKSQSHSIPMDSQINLIDFLTGLLQKDVEPKSLEWLKNQTEKIRTSGVPSQFFLAFSQASRFFKKDPLMLTDSEKAMADSLVSGF